MRKLLYMLGLSCLVLALSACDSNEVIESSVIEEQNSESVSQVDKDSFHETEESESTEKILVAYFSNTGNTRAVAGYIAQVTGAELYEIVPEQLYTTEDLNYRDDSSRSSAEMKDLSARPTISGSVEQMEQYDMVFVGYPIWWGEAPRIVSTFMESYDFSGKTLIPFCTSGSSGFGTSDAALKTASPDAKWLNGNRFNGNVSQEEVIKWLNDLDLAISN